MTALRGGFCVPGGAGRANSGKLPLDAKSNAEDLEPDAIPTAFGMRGEKQPAKYLIYKDFNRHTLA
jgi:hypothetical protein